MPRPGGGSVVSHTMVDMLILAIALITAALCLYTVGVWSEHRAGVLRPAHVAWFVTGLLADASGTLVMSRIAAAGSYRPAGETATVLSQVMALTGALALALMAVHAVWAVVVLVRQRPAELAQFHRFSLGVWLVWLVPYMTGMAGSMA